MTRSVVFGSDVLRGRAITRSVDFGNGLIVRAGDCALLSSGMIDCAGGRLRAVVFGSDGLRGRAIARRIYESLSHRIKSAFFPIPRKRQ